MFGILCLIFVIVAPFFVYRNAKQNEHNPVFWTLLSVTLGIGFQFIIPFFIGIVFGLYWVNQGYSAEAIQQSFQGPANVIELICLFLSIVGIFLIFRRVSAIRDFPELHLPAPPEPPKF